MKEEWKNFKTGNWINNIDVKDFILNNYKEYLGNEDFLKPISEKTSIVFKKCEKLISEELQKGVLDIDVDHVSGINSYDAGYIDKENEVIFGLQTDAPLKRIVNPYGGIRMVHSSLEAYGKKLDDNLNTEFTTFRKTHNDGVFDCYTEDIRRARSAGLLTGLPDAYGRGRIIGDYRRIALYGINILIATKLDDLEKITNITPDSIRLREELSEQIRALKEIKDMALTYGFD